MFDASVKSFLLKYDTEAAAKLRFVKRLSIPNLFASLEFVQRHSS